MPVLGRRKKKGVYEGPVARSEVPGVPGAYAFYPVEYVEPREPGRFRKPRRGGDCCNKRQPLVWVDHSPGTEDCDGHWEWVS